MGVFVHSIARRKGCTVLGGYPAAQTVSLNPAGALTRLFVLRSEVEWSGLAKRRHALGRVFSRGISTL